MFSIYPIPTVCGWWRAGLYVKAMRRNLYRTATRSPDERCNGSNKDSGGASISPQDQECRKQGEILFVMIDVEAQMCDARRPLSTV